MSEDQKFSQYQMEISRLMTQISTKLDILITTFDGHLIDDKKNFADINNKLYAQMRFYWMGLGFIAAVEVFLKFVKF